MDYTPRKQAIHDKPWVWLNECRLLLAVGPGKWRQIWEEVYKFEVKHWLTRNQGTQVNVETLLQAIYPATKKDLTLLTMLSRDFMWRINEERRRMRIYRRDLRERKEAAKNGDKK